MEFTSESLRKFIETPRAAKLPEEERASGARTNRGDRVTKILQGAGSGGPGGKLGPEGVDPLLRFDAAIRSNLAELVRNMMQEGKFDKLAELLQDHRQFIDNILGLLEKKG